MLFMIITQNMKVEETKTKIHCLKNYLDIIRPYLRDMINNYKASIKLRNLSGKTIDDDIFGE